MSTSLTTTPTINADFVLTRRRDLRQNQKDFWAELGVTQSGGSRYESGRAMPRPLRRLIYLIHVMNLPDRMRGDVATI